MNNADIPIKKANTIADIFEAVGETRPLTIAEMDQFYLDTDAVRGDLSTRRRLASIIRKNAASGRNGHILFVGARGAGKSTELNHLQKDIENEILVFNYSVLKELDPQSISYIELFIVTMEKLFDYALQNNLEVDKSLLSRISKWTSTKEIKEIKDKHLSIEASAGTDTKAGIPFLHQFFFQLKGAAKASKSFKETLKDTIEPRLSDLISFCNELIAEIRIKALNAGFNDIIIVIEDLDKIPLETANRLFFNYANQLVQLKATVIYTFPVTLNYNKLFNTISGYFSEVVDLPMIKVNQKDGQPFLAGRQVLKKIVTARINQSLFANETILDKMVEMTGGALRGLFRMVNDAAFAAEDRGKAMIGEEEYVYAFRQIKRDYENTIADFTVNGITIITADQYFKELANLAMSTDKQPTNSDILMDLRQNLSVLSYNGENWCDVHPVMKEILKERRYI